MFLATLILDKLKQSLNASLPIFDTVEGMFIEERPIQPWNASYPISNIPSTILNTPTCCCGTVSNIDFDLSYSQL